MADRPIMFQGREIDHNWLVSLHDNARRQKWHRDFRVRTAMGIRRKTMTVELSPSWVRRHPQAASWVVKVLPERRTLERDLIASAGAVEPTVSRVALGELDRDNDDAEACENYLEEWRKGWVPYQTFVEKAAEDGEFGVVVLPTAVDMEGAPDFYDRLDERAWEALDDERKAEYAPDETKPGRYARRDERGDRLPNPAYDRDEKGRKRRPGDKGFKRDDDKSREAHQKALQRYLLKDPQGGVTVRVIPALDCAPFLTRGTKRDRWKLLALLERTLYYPEELLRQGYGWAGMGDRALVPQGFDATRTSGQDGMFYLYTLYMVNEEYDEEAKRVIRRPTIAYSVAGQPTYHEKPGKGQRNGEGVAIIDLYEQFGLEGPFWWYGGGMHTSDDDSDFYWEPYLWPFAETIMGIEGMTTMANAATSTQGTPGFFYKPDPALVGGEGVDPEALLDAETGELLRPKIPEAGEIETATGEVFPAMPGQVSPDVWRSIQNEMLSLRENTALEQPSAAGASGHAQVVKETLAQTAKRHIREGALEATKFCVESALRIFHALSVTYDVNWPIQTTRERPVGATRDATDILEFDPAWVGDGEFGITAQYAAEENLARVEQEASLAERGFGSFEDVQEARGKPDAESEWAKVLKWRIRQQPAYIEAQVTRLAKRQGNRLMLQVLNLQKQQRMTEQGMPGFEAGLPTAALNRAGEGGTGFGGGPTSAQQSRAGAISGEVGTAARMADAQAQMQVGQGQGAA